MKTSRIFFSLALVGMLALSAAAWAGPINNMENHRGSGTHMAMMNDNNCGTSGAMSGHQKMRAMGSRHMGKTAQAGHFMNGATGPMHGTPNK